MVWTTAIVPFGIGIDNGGEVKSKSNVLCNNIGIKAKKSLPWNPQSSAILEIIYQVLQDALTSADLYNRDIEMTMEVCFMNVYLTKGSYYAHN